MSKPLLYRPSPKWHVSAALAASVLLHLGAVAASRTESAVPAAPAEDGTIVYIDFPEVPAPDERPPIDLPPPPSMPPIEDSLIPEDATPSPPPPVQRRITALPAPIRRPATMRVAGPTSMTAAKVAAISAPRPDYPYEARRQRATGTGIVVLNVDPATGYVVSASMRQSTGNVVLDAAALSAFKRWRFKPGSVSLVQTPITFTMTGAQY
ncbi:MAG: energy transducer TonB [Chthoniobacterales bacterium]